MSYAHTPETTVELFLESSARARAAGRHIASLAIGGTAFSGLGAATLALGWAGIVSVGLTSALGFATATTGMILLSLMLLRYGSVARHLVRFGDGLSATGAVMGVVAGAAGMIWALSNVTLVLGTPLFLISSWGVALKALSTGSLVTIVFSLWVILTIEVLKRTRVATDS